MKWLKCFPSALAIVLVIGAAPIICSADDSSARTFAWKRDAGSLALVQDAQVVWQFNFGTNATKPFFHPIALPGGPVITWDRPADHRWHRALWFSWKFINGVNYWEEDPRTGAADGRTEWQSPQVETWPDCSARITLNLTYRPATNAQPVLTEHREIEISPPDQHGIYHLDWTMKFTAGSQEVLLDRTPLPGEPGGKPWGGYGGLSVRLASNIVERAAATTEEAITFADGSYRGKAAAVDYSGKFSGQEAGIAMFDSPSNTNTPSPWYVIKNNTMSFFTPAVLCYRPLSIKAGDSLRLRYRVVVHPGRWDAGQLRREAERFSPARSSKVN